MPRFVVFLTTPIPFEGFDTNLVPVLEDERVTAPLFEPEPLTIVYWLRELIKPPEFTVLEPLPAADLVPPNRPLLSVE